MGKLFGLGIKFQANYELAKSVSGKSKHKKVFTSRVNNEQLNCCKLYSATFAKYFVTFFSLGIRRFIL